LYANWIKEKPVLAEIDSQELPSEDDRLRLKAFRNGVQHLDDRVVKGKSRGQLTFVKLCPKHAEFEGVEIGYLELARWIDQLDSLASRLTSELAPSDWP
jgi:hypothetical protein